MRVVVAVVGRARAGGLATAIHAYEERAGRYWPLDVQEVREESARSGATELVRQREGERLLARVGGTAVIVACDVAGESMSSEQFAAWLARERDAAHDVAFLVGGAFGLSDAVRSRATRRLSLSPLTLPHELARLVLAEQLYRAGTIARGEPYHK
jgi:23S rRNA (pseudouridine1915-N3)-methyltransferase